jgi:hypothetical protein
LQQSRLCRSEGLQVTGDEKPMFASAQDSEVWRF